MGRVTGRAAPATQRPLVCLLWEDEVEKLVADAASLPPAATEAVRTVLESVLVESETETEIRESARWLLARVAIPDDDKSPSLTAAQVVSPDASRQRTRLVRWLVAA
jgi:hypothetical protein